MPASIARITLNRARYFLRQANTCGVDDPEGCTANLEAAIQFGRNVTLRMQTALTHHTGFREWYVGAQEKMAGVPVFDFLNGVRRDIVHLDRSPVTRSTTLHLEPLVFELRFGELFIKPQRGQDVRTTARDLYQWWVRRPVYILSSRIRIRLKPLRARLRRVRPPKVTQEFYFDDPAWNGRPCRELVAEYLDRLEEIVADSERRFPEDRN